MKLSNAILTAAVVQAVGIVLAERRHRQRLDLEGVGLHQKLCSDITQDPAQLELWATGDLTGEEFLRSVAANRQVAFLQWKFRAGLIKKDELRVQLWHLMKRAGVREFWERHRDFRFAETNNRRDQQFLTIFAEAHAEAVKKLETAA